MLSWVKVIQGIIDHHDPLISLNKACFPGRVALGGFLPLDSHDVIDSHVYTLMHHMSTSITGVSTCVLREGYCFRYTCDWNKNFINPAVQEDVLERIAAVTDGYKAPWFFTVQTRWCMHQYMLTREGSCLNECASQGY